jgi:hypothetical protein
MIALKFFQPLTGFRRVLRLPMFKMKLRVTFAEYSQAAHDRPWATRLQLLGSNTAAPFVIAPDAL